jgi:hypothetical protein
MQRGNPSKIIGKGFDKHPENINKNGRPKKIPNLDVLLAEIFDDKEMAKLVKALYSAALKGNVRAAEAILDRAYGKAKQSMDITSDGKGLNPINIVIDKQDASV